MLSTLNSINPDIKNAVFGYMRLFRKFYKLNIPQSIDLLCLKYFYSADFHQIDQWDQKCLSNSIHLDNTEISIISRRSGSGTSSFLSQRVKLFTYQWKFKIGHKIKESSTFGIWRINNQIKPQQVIDKNCFRCYHPYCIGLKWSDLRFAKEITMILDVRKLELRYILNHGKYKIIWNPNPIKVPSGEYIGVVNLYGMWDSVTLLPNNTPNAECEDISF